MPFNYKQYEQQCSRMSRNELLREVERQSDTIASAGAGTGFAVLAIPLTMGLSAVAVGATAPAIINARKKRSIAQKYLAMNPSEFGPNFSTTPSSSGSIGTGSKSSKAASSEEQLPLYSEYDKDLTGGDTREKQTYVPVEELAMDLPPTYDEATLKRMTMMRRSSTTENLSSEIENSTSHRSRRASRSKSPSTASSHSSRAEPRTPSPSRAGDLTNLSTNEDMQQRKEKGIVRFNMFTSSERPSA